MGFVDKKPVSERRVSQTRIAEFLLHPRFALRVHEPVTTGSLCRGTVSRCYTRAISVDTPQPFTTRVLDGPSARRRSDVSTERRQVNCANVPSERATTTGATACPGDVFIAVSQRWVRARCVTQHTPHQHFYYCGAARFDPFDSTVFCGAQGGRNRLTTAAERYQPRRF